MTVTPFIEDGRLAEIVVNAIACAEEPIKTKEITRHAFEHHPDQFEGMVTSPSLRRRKVREELVELEKIGCVVRFGRTRGTRWGLG